MTIVLFSYDSSENIKAEICLDKFEKSPYLSIYKTSGNHAQELYRNYYTSVSNAKKALYRYAKRYDLQPFRNVYNWYGKETEGK